MTIILILAVIFWFIGSIFTFPAFLLSLESGFGYMLCKSEEDKIKVDKYLRISTIGLFISMGLSGICSITVIIIKIVF